MQSTFGHHVKLTIKSLKQKDCKMLQQKGLGNDKVIRYIMVLKSGGNSDICVREKREAVI